MRQISMLQHFYAVSRAACVKEEGLGLGITLDKHRLVKINSGRKRNRGAYAFRLRLTLAVI